MNILIKKHWNNKNDKSYKSDENKIFVIMYTSELEEYMNIQGEKRYEEK
jgi:hypothetical protein